ncbi:MULTISPECIES: copper amine oxidase N-terminal domain-containing protein [unclassified Paenibacillus]|uniref:copper amine oxidase N-terminal domain-containing protein n=1 Tax=unclassified Paenibacillus TaxID=185978 RepID=UPI001C11EE18|nr:MULTISPECIES: copper amine oxidase N-terminal domain-containing protein [unclassified Paenibacillus]MBU5445072.1 copper amine oxidase N-terminal domain-containing protein [Paenibacillus sp. MSJ-34]CAH0119016.1 hypothetical protein PAE9249_01513 [Paenibacillus sp. CECT 9249]
MNKKWVSFMMGCVLLTIAGTASAHPGRTDANGGHTCRTNCEKWGLSYGEYHYHGGKSKSGSSGSKTKPASNKSVDQSKTSAVKKQAKQKKEYEPANISVSLGEQTLHFSHEPIKKNEIILVPMRDIFTALGAEVEWNGSTQTITAAKGDILIQLTIGQKKAYVNGEKIELEEPAVAVEGKTMVPLRFVTEALGAQIQWNQDTKSIEITL